MKVIFKNYENLSEISGNYTQWSFLKQNEDLSWQGLHSPFVCKDFMQDMFWAYRTGKKNYSIYGFKFEENLNAIIKDSHYFLGIRQQTNSSKLGPFHKIDEQEDNLNTFLNFFYQEIFKVREKLRFSSNDEGNIIVMKLHRSVFDHPTKISLLTFLVRIGLKYTSDKDPLTYLKETELFGNDAGYRSAAIKVVDKIKEGFMFKNSFDTFKSVNDIHDNSGIVACSNKINDFFMEKVSMDENFIFTSEQQIVDYIKSELNG